MTHRLMAALRKAGGTPVLLDKGLLCITLDVIGRIGFAKDFGATAGFEALTSGSAPASGPGKQGTTLYGFCSTFLGFIPCDNTILCGFLQPALHISSLGAGTGCWSPWGYAPCWWHVPYIDARPLLWAQH